jgi:predicted dinucleotide-binding enzyme
MADHESPDASCLVVGILGGTGQQGCGLARRLAIAGNQVIIGSRNAERAVAAATKLGGEAGMAVRGQTNRDAARTADLVIAALPWEGHDDMLSALASELAGKILVDCANPVGFDSRGAYALAVPAGSAAEQAAALLPDTTVVAAFQHLSAELLLDPAIDSVPERRARDLHRHGHRRQAVRDPRGPGLGDRGAGWRAGLCARRRTGGGLAADAGGIPWRRDAGPARGFHCRQADRGRARLLWGDESPDAVAFSPDGATAWVAYPATNRVIPVSTATGRAGKPVRTVRTGSYTGTGYFPMACVVTADGKWVYVSAGVGVDAIRTSTRQVTRIKAGPGSIDPIYDGATIIAVSPDGKTVYVLGYHGSHPGTLTPISVATNKPGKPIRVGVNPISMAIVP